VSKLPVISGRECVNALQRAGFRVRRQRGSHIVMQKDDPYRVVSVPNHKTLKPGTLRGIINDAGMTVDEFRDLL
jgi:predicted RNA binding protein YcfA (HicA-like mRNA interferase family)